MAPYAVIEIGALTGIVACVVFAITPRMRPHALQALVAPPCFIVGGYTGIFTLLLAPATGPIWSLSPTWTGVIIVSIFLGAGLLVALVAASIAGRIQRAASARFSRTPSP